MTPDRKDQERNRFRCMYPIRFSLLAIAALASLSPAATAADRLEVENIRVGFGESNSFKVGTWTPIWVQVKGASQPFKGIIELSVGDDDGTPTSFRQAIEIAANQSQRVTLYARPGSRDPELTIRLFDDSGRRVLSTTSAVVMRQQPSPIAPAESLLLTLGQPLGLDAIIDLPGFRKSAPSASGARGADDEIVIETHRSHRRRHARSLVRLRRSARRRHRHRRPPDDGRSRSFPRPSTRRLG